MEHICDCTLWSGQDLSRARIPAAASSAGRWCHVLGALHQESPYTNRTKRFPAQVRGEPFVLSSSAMRYPDASHCQRQAFQSRTEPSSPGIGRPQNRSCEPGSAVFRHQAGRMFLTEGRLFMISHSSGNFRTSGSVYSRMFTLGP